MKPPPVTNPDGSPTIARRRAGTPRIVEVEHHKGHPHHVVLPARPSLAARVAKPLLFGAVIACLAGGIAAWLIGR